MQKQVKRYLSLLITVALMTSIILSDIPVASAAPTGASVEYTDSVLEAFQNPNHRQKPMVRMWMPDAAAGIDPYDNVEKTIQELAKAGFGGVEVTALTDGVDYNNPELTVIGWGTPAWKETLKKILRAANAIEGGFVVDLTVTAHWPALINAIDPNDDAAMRETQTTYQKLTNAALDAGAIQLTLPPEKTNSTAGGGISKPAYFIYASKHVSTALARVTAVNSSGAPTSYDFDSMIFVDEDVAPLARNVGGWAAGVPDEAEFDRRKAANLPVTTISPDMGDMTYQTHVVDIFGSEPAPGADLSGSYNGKQDANGNRARMQDWQYEYELEFTGETKTALGSYTASAGPDIAVGDWAVINVFNRGTGQTTSGPPGILAPDMMFNRQYVTNYLSASGINALLDYWNKNILDTEMINLLKANGNSSIFDDSLEIRATQGSSFWTNEIESELSGQAYSWQDQFPFVVAFGANSFATSANTGVPSRIIQDYNLLLGNLYNVGHCQVIEEWAQGFGYSFRSQCFTMNGVDIPLAATHCIPEGDNGCKGDGLRQLSSVVNMFDKPVLSMEAVTVSGGNLKITWADAITEVAQNYSNGVNRVILHGAPYSKSFNGYFGGWPGWQAFGTAYGDAYTYKQPYWEDADTMTGYFARNQAVLQKGLAKVDLLVLRDQSSVFSNGNGNTFQTLLDRGYSYNMTSEGVIKLDGVSVSNGVICENGPAYKALILSNVTNISAPAMQKILGMAQAGLPVILYGASVPTTVYGTDSAGNNTAAMLNLYSQLTALDNVYSTADQDALLDTLTGINIVPAASYNIAKLQASRYIDKTTGTNYYYMFNDVRNGASGMLNNNSSPSATWKGGAATAGTVTLTGNGVPCLLDAWTGAIEPVTVYTDNGNGTVSFDISLSGGESKMYAVLPLTEAPPSVKSVSGGAEIIGAESGLALRAGAPGTYDVTRRDGAKLPVTVTSVPSSIDLNSGWSLRLESWGPDDSADNKQAPIEGIPYNPIYLTYDRSAFDSSGKTGYDGIWKEPSATIKSDISFSNIQLMKWADLPASPQQLQNIGVSSMANVSGIGYYTNKFILSSDWENAGAILNMSYGRDSVTKLTVNGHVFDNVNNVTDKMDIGDYLISGAENTIEIKIASTLFNRARLTNMADMRATGAQANLTDNGLTSVTLTPYAQVSLVYSIDAIARTGGTVTGGGEYSIGSSVTLKAAPNSNYRFDGWYEGAVKVSSSAYYTFRVNSDRALQASFTYVAPGSTPIIEYFNNPDMSSKPMARMWFPDAEAGVDDNDLIEKQIFELADKGFGGVEVAMLADGVNYSNAEGKEYGWGTENWSKLLKKVLKAAAKVPGGFQVDMTITAHWPPALNTIDPNDDAANKELSYSFTKIIDSDLTLNDYIELNLPPTKTSIAAGGFGGGGAAAGFVFTDTFVSAAIAQVDSINVSGTTESYVLDIDTLTPITNQVEIKMGGSGPGGAAGQPAGVPDQAVADSLSMNYQTNVVDLFGPEPSTPPAGKIDADGNRKRMADWQYEYLADFSGSTINKSPDDSSTINAGDWVIVSVFYRGTGQRINGGRIMHNGVFVTNYFNEEGTKVLTDYWDGMLGRDPELKALMQANKGYIFEDSIEASGAAAYWAPSIMNDIGGVYNKDKDVLSIVAASRYLRGAFGPKTLVKFFEFSDESRATRIYETYNDLLAGLYRNYRVTGVSEWANKTVGWGFRGQTYHLPGLEIASAAMLADVAETDNMAKGDGVRYQAGTVNITGRDYLTMEAMTGLTVVLASLGDIRTEQGQNYSDGVNRTILHGTPYAKTFNGYNSTWPGWLPFGPSSFGDAYTYRQAYWDDITTETNFMARTQAILQKGTAQIDLAVLIDKEETFDFQSMNNFQNLLDRGYSYNPISESILSHPNATVDYGRLAPNGPAFKALIVDQVSLLSVNGIDRLLDYANKGLPIVIYDSDISRVYGDNDDDDAILAAKLIELKSKAGVRIASTKDAVLDALIELNVVPYSSYNAPQLETTMYTDPVDGTNYYYMYNNAVPTNSGMMPNGAGKRYKGESKAVQNAMVTLEGGGVPYLLDAATGAITQVGEYTINSDGTVSFVINKLYGGDSVIYAVTNNTSDFPAPRVYVKSVDKPSSNYSVERTSAGAIELRSNDPATYSVTLSDNTVNNVSITKALSVLDLSGGQWGLVIHSYGPEDPVGDDPSESKITTVDFGKQNLGNWEDINASGAQLAALGVPHMWYVSGEGEYSLTFNTPSGWDSSTGAYLDVTYGWDQIGSVTVNGVVFPANNASDHIDIGSALVPGSNTIVIRLTTTLFARTFLENGGYNDNSGTTEPAVTGGFGGGGATPYNNGLLSVVLTPYTHLEVGGVIAPTPSPTPTLPPPKGSYGGSQGKGGAPQVSTTPAPTPAPSEAPGEETGEEQGGEQTPAPTSDQSSKPQSLMADITPDYWAFEFIDGLVARGIVDGYPMPDGSREYHPEDDITRLEMAKLIVASLELDLIYDYDGSDTFADWNDVQEWGRPYMAAAIDAGIVLGSAEEDGLYLNPDDNIIREEMIAMSVRALGAEVPEGGECDAPDFDAVSEWAMDDVAFAVDNGMINLRQGNVAPGSNATRAESAMILYKLLEYLGI